MKNGHCTINNPIYQQMKLNSQEILILKNSVGPCLSHPAQLNTPPSAQQVRNIRPNKTRPLFYILSIFFYSIIILMNIKHLCILALAHSLVLTSISTYTFDLFLHQFNKQYGPQQLELRKGYFQQNMLLLIEKQQEGIIIPPNHFLDYSPEELSIMTNFIPEIPNESVSGNHIESQIKGVAASTFDYRFYGKISAVKNQGTCGSGWAFAVTAYYQSLLLIEKGIQYDLAEQYVLQCTVGSSCAAGWPQDGMQTIRSTGMPIESKFPYQQNDTYYSNICETTDNFIKLINNIRYIRYDYQAYSNPEQIKHLLLTYGPLTVGVSAGHPGFFFPTSEGIIEDCSPLQNVDHVVQLVGYTENHWIVKNSWGKDWGNNGFGYIPFESDCHIKTNVWSLQLEGTINPIPPSPDPVPVPQGQIILNVEMKDLGGDGWNGNIFGFKQGNQYAGIFGDTFSQGSQINSSISLPVNTQTQIVVYQLGENLQQCEFLLFFDNGTLLFHKYPESSPANTIFFSFCLGNCTQNHTLLITLTDAWCDGWQSNTIKFIQGENQVEVGAEFIDGFKYGPISQEFLQGQQIQIISAVYGVWQSQIGFKVTDSTGFLLFKRDSGVSYAPNEVLGTFTPGSINPLSVKFSSQNKLEEGSSQLSENSLIDEEQFENKLPLSLKVSVVCLSLLMGMQLVLLCYFLKKLSKKQTINNQQMQDSYTKRMIR